MNTRIILKIVKKLDQIEQNEKSHQEAELQFSMQGDIEKEKLTNYEMLTINYLHQKAWSLWTSWTMNNNKNKKRHANIHLCRS